MIETKAAWEAFGVLQRGFPDPLPRDEARKAFPAWYEGIRDCDPGLFARTVGQIATYHDDRPDLGQFLETYARVCRLEEDRAEILERRKAKGETVGDYSEQRDSPFLGLAKIWEARNYKSGRARDATTPQDEAQRRLGEFWQCWDLHCAWAEQRSRKNAAPGSQKPPAI